jgi:hypothetical protein
LINILLCGCSPTFRAAGLGEIYIWKLAMATGRASGLANYLSKSHFERGLRSRRAVKRQFQIGELRP